MSEANTTDSQQRGAGTAGESTHGPKVALVTGATGITGRALLRHLSKKTDFKRIYGVSRRKLDEEGAGNVVHLGLDLLDSSALKNKLEESSVKDVTHVYHTAFPGDTSNTDMSAATMLKNVVESLEGAGNPLEHVYVQEGTKAYGLHLGHDFKSPFKESDPRHIPPNFYYAFEDYLLERVAKGVSWKWSILRPGAVVGYSPGTVMSLLQVLAVYGTFCREYNLPLRFPGSSENYHALFDCCDVDLLAEAAIWLSLHPEAGNEIYNISNGDTFRWKHIWPKVAEVFGLEAGPVQSLELKTMLNTPDKHEMWKAIQKKYDLQPIPYSQLGACTLEFGDAWFALPDAFAVVNKLARAGFHQQVLDTDQVLFEKLEELQKKKIIPPYLSMS